ncbi:MAG: hypothetical protein COU81_00210 [Candidatus Portnoybacteria bacterium CG10_big_fil_rev_8_21_14_0_10_36_7]|uniref:Uncharacterized protein n=1 Tax=Candidatus Portnoybacteria bacterium CG10_big_fil_rev_8_21_14_0_10_36_7 TaxID=1974812 RepID=A0A2M8KF21_9BACT|nr:MAG: hypothetical protein COU81_00210 [Candidatus Portnoybacteria bacterium CG10_big_fil_rev_8_21_14_0_10_36_7]
MNEKNTAALGVKLYTPNGKILPWDFEYFPNNFRESAGYLIGFFANLYPNYVSIKKIASNFILHYYDFQASIKVDLVVEGCFIVNTKIFNELRGFDEKFWMFFEGSDLCYRIAKAGYDILYDPNINVIVQDGHTHTNIFI